MMFDDLPKEELLKIIDTYAKAWQAMDGAYFLALEKKYGMDVAIEMDKEAWKIFSPASRSMLATGKLIVLPPSSSPENTISAIIQSVTSSRMTYVPGSKLEKVILLPIPSLSSGLTSSRLKKAKGRPVDIKRKLVPSEG